MRAKGVAYDTGFIRNGEISRGHFDPEVVSRELTIIRDDLHCTAIQIIGGDPERLELAAGYAAELGLEVWFSPYPLELSTGEILSLFADCAERAERVRQRGAEVVDQVNDLLGNAVATVRERFQGRITYAAIPIERVDWTPFDIVSVELIRNAEVAGQYREGVRTLVAQGKPVAITGFGSATYRGAGDRGARAMEIVEYDESTGAPVRLDDEYIRDEAGQAANLAEVLEIFDTEGVDGAFVFLFALSNFPHRPDGDPRLDLDMASPAIVKTLEGRHGDAYADMTWEPKAAFTAVADCFTGG